MFQGLRKIMIPLLAASLAFAGMLMCQASAEAAGPEWRELRPGLRFGLLDGSQYVRVGEPWVAVLEVDPARYSFKVLAAEGGDSGFSAGQWRRQSKALAVVNAGQHTPEKKYLGLLMHQGKAKSRLVTHLKALFLAEPQDKAMPQARVLDLRYTAFDPRQNPYQEAAQSLMLLDRLGEIRVRKSPKLAHRTAVAESESGRIVIIVTEGGYTLWEFAKFVSESGLKLHEVMSMDGGKEAQLDILVDGFRYRQYGNPSSAPGILNILPDSPIPAALGIYPR
jgi:uncharacterized protein YigE (DUF2233 family)